MTYELHDDKTEDINYKADAKQRNGNDSGFDKYAQYE